MLSGGFDLKVMRSSPEAAGRLVTDGGALFSRLFGSEVPVIVACSGPRGRGRRAAAARCRLPRRRARRFRIGLIETQIGMVLPRWAAELARERISPRHFQQATVGRADVRPRRRRRRRLPRRGGRADDARRRAAAEAQALGRAARAARTGARCCMNRGERLGRLADAIAADRGRTFDVPVTERSTECRVTGRVAAPVASTPEFGVAAVLIFPRSCSPSSGSSSWPGPSTCCSGARNSAGWRRSGAPGSPGARATRS